MVFMCAGTPVRTAACSRTCSGASNEKTEMPDRDLRSVNVSGVEIALKIDACDRAQHRSAHRRERLAVRQHKADRLRVRRLHELDDDDIRGAGEKTRERVGND